MKRIVLATMMALCVVALAPAQARKDACHVYVVDVARGTQKVFAEFRPVIGEEELTTKTYRFPRSRLTITASVYYTDESMASASGADSMMVGIVVAPKAQRDAISGENNAVAEVTMNASQDTVRAQKYLKVNGRLYLVGVECHCKERLATNYVDAHTDVIAEIQTMSRRVSSQSREITDTLRALRRSARKALELGIKMGKTSTATLIGWTGRFATHAKPVSVKIFNEHLAGMPRIIRWWVQNRGAAFLVLLVKRIDVVHEDRHPHPRLALTSLTKEDLNLSASDTAEVRWVAPVPLLFEA